MDRRSRWLALFALVSCTEPPAEPPTTSPYSTELSIVSDGVTISASAVAFRGQRRWRNTLECTREDLVCVGLPGFDPLATEPHATMLRSEVVRTVGGVPLEETVYDDWASISRSASFPILDEGVVTVDLDGVRVDLPLLPPIRERAAPDVPGRLAFRWIPGDGPLELHLEPLEGPRLPVVLAVDDTGALDLPLDALGLHPDVSAFAATLSRVAYGLVDGPPPVHWSSRSIVGRTVVSKPVLPTVSDCDGPEPPLQPGTYRLPGGADPHARLGEVPPGHILRAHQVGGVFGPTGCMPGWPGRLELVLLPESPTGDVRLSSGWDLEVELEPRPPLLAQHPCEPVVSGRYLMDLGSDGDPSCPDHVQAEVALAVQVPANGVFTLFAPNLGEIALCGEGSECVAEDDHGVLRWHNDAAIAVDLTLEGRTSATAWSVVDLRAEQPVVQAPADGCGGPALLLDGPAVVAPMDGLTRTVPVDDWTAPGWPDGTFSLPVEADTTVEVEVWGAVRDLEVLHDCADRSTSMTEVPDHLARRLLRFRNVGPAHTYTLFMRAEEAPLVRVRTVPEVP
jgi:hypothetical protein